MIPPLIVTEPEILDAIGRIDRAMKRIEQVKGPLLNPEWVGFRS
jgi:hypothetical protein